LLFISNETLLNERNTSTRSVGMALVKPKTLLLFKEELKLGDHRLNFSARFRIAVIKMEIKGEIKMKGIFFNGY
jgi:hypothetical protein